MPISFESVQLTVMLIGWLSHRFYEDVAKVLAHVMIMVPLSNKYKFRFLLVPLAKIYWALEASKRLSMVTLCHIQPSLEPEQETIESKEAGRARASVSAFYFARNQPYGLTAWIHLVVVGLQLDTLTRTIWQLWRHGVSHWLAVPGAARNCTLGCIGVFCPFPVRRALNSQGVCQHPNCAYWCASVVAP